MRVGILLIFIIGLGIVAYVEVRKLVPSDTVQTTTNAAETGGPLTALQRSRDQRRLLDVRLLQSALAAYKAQPDAVGYPVVIEDLIPEFLGVMPRDPKTGKQFRYTPSGEFYQIGFTLEIGAEGLSAGEHIATPSGIQ